MGDRLFFNACIRTMDAANPHAEALAVRDGRIAAVGKKADVLRSVGPGTEEVDLDGATVLPGFNDAHVHIWKVGQLLTGMLDVRGTESLGELAESLRAHARTLAAGEWLQARGYNEATLAEGRHPTRRDLDAVLPDRPALLTRTCAHIAVANSAALERAGITRSTPDPPGGAIERDDAGEPTGVLHETALGLVKAAIPQPTREEYARMILAGMEHLLRCGVTSATDPAVHPELLEAYMDLDARGALPLRANLLAIRRPDGGTETLPLPPKHCSDFLRVEGIKLFADGGLSGATAALRVPYRHAATQGILRLDAEELYALSREAHLAGYRVGVHAIGDAAIDAVLDAFEGLMQLGPGGPHRVEHFGLPDREHLQRMKELGAFSVPQAIFLRELGENFRRYLPSEYLGRTYPLRAILDAGIPLALSSDTPVVRDCRPLAGMEAAVLRRDASGEALAPEQSITVGEAMRAYTEGGARASGDWSDRGSLAPGKWADFVVLDRNPFEVPPEELSQIGVRRTVVAGADAWTA